MSTGGSGSDAYQPIACAIHDRLEAAATLRRPVRITFRDEGGEVHEVEDRVLDVFARDGAEFVKLASGPVVRLDGLVTVDGVPLR